MIVQEKWQNLRQERKSDDGKWTDHVGHCQQHQCVCSILQIQEARWLSLGPTQRKPQLCTESRCSNPSSQKTPQKSLFCPREESWWKLTDPFWRQCRNWKTYACALFQSWKIACGMFLPVGPMISLLEWVCHEVRVSHEGPNWRTFQQKMGMVHKSSKQALSQ